MTSDKTKWVLVNNLAKTRYTLDSENWPLINGASPKEVATEEFLDTLMAVHGWNEDDLNHDTTYYLYLIWEKLKKLVTVTNVEVLCQESVDPSYMDIGNLYDTLWVTHD